MRRIAIAMMIVLPFMTGIVSGVYWSAKLPSTYENSAFGFRMRSPSLSPKAGNGMIAMFHLDASEEFAPNVNIMAQPATPPAEFRKISLSQFESMGLKLVREKEGKLSGTETITWEYSGKMQGRELCFLSTAVFCPEWVLLATCTATPTQFEKYKAGFQEALASIELTKLPK